MASALWSLRFGYIYNLLFGVGTGVDFVAALQVKQSNLPGFQTI